MCLPLFLGPALPLAGAPHKRDNGGQADKGEETVHKDIKLVQVLDAHQMSNLQSTEVSLGVDVSGLTPCASDTKSSHSQRRHGTSSCKVGRMLLAAGHPAAGSLSQE